MPAAPLKAFASHDWGVDGLNHKRVAKVVAMLRERGIDTWFDSDHMRGNILDSMCRGIDECNVVLVFVTQQYIDKVQSGSSTDNVRREFMYAQNCKADSMIVVRFDPGLGRCWPGPVGMVLGSQLYVDLSRDEFINEASISSLVKLMQPRALVRVPSAALARPRLKSASRTTATVCTSGAPRGQPSGLQHALQIARAPSLQNALQVGPAPVVDIRSRVQKVASLLNLQSSGLHIAQILARAAETLGIAPNGDGHEVFCDRLARVEAQLGLGAGA